MQIAVFASKDVEDQTEPIDQQILVWNLTKGLVPQPTCILKRSNKHDKNDRTDHSHVGPLDDFSRSLTRMLSPRNNKESFSGGNETIKLS